MRRMNKDEEHLGKLRDFYAKINIIPRLAVIAELTGMKSSSAFVMVNRLKKKGYLESYGTQLRPGQRFFESVLLDTLPARKLQSAADNQPISVDIVRRLLKNPSRSVLVRVNGDSMKDVCLIDGDYVVVQRGAVEAVEGKIVVAEVDGEYTVKFLAKDKKGNFYLEPANGVYQPTRPNKKLKIYGVVTGSFRSYTA
jgi:SOS-response transcriptional repressor LexA